MRDSLSPVCNLIKNDYYLSFILFLGAWMTWQPARDILASSKLWICLKWSDVLKTWSLILLNQKKNWVSFGTINNLIVTKICSLMINIAVYDFNSNELTCNYTIIVNCQMSYRGQIRHSSIYFVFFISYFWTIKHVCSNDQCLLT